MDTFGCTSTIGRCPLFIGAPSLHSHLRGRCLRQPLDTGDITSNPGEISSSIIPSQKSEKLRHNAKW